MKKHPTSLILSQQDDTRTITQGNENKLTVGYGARLARWMRSRKGTIGIAVADMSRADNSGTRIIFVAPGMISRHQSFLKGFFLEKERT
jgi:hypothetical protein